MSDEHASTSPTNPMEEVLVSPSSDGLNVDDLTGYTLAGRYDVERPIGKGGMGLVYLARQSALNRQVVVKVLAQDVCDNEEAITRFEREALGLSQLQHPNIVTIYDFGQDQGMAYIVMEYVDGRTLNSMIRRDGPMNFDDFAHISTQILDGLSEAHARGIIHRDIKPSNIMLCTRRGHANVVKVLDFGLAKIVHDPQEVTKKTNLVGSVAFLAPEQILGNAFDQRVDVYALGVLFYYMLSGERPFHGDDDMAVLYQHIHKDPASLADILPVGHQVPPEVISIIHQCLSKDPNARPNDARAVLELFQRDMSRSIFQMPWSTGEWAVPTGVQVMSPHLHDGMSIEGLAHASSASDISIPQFNAGDEEILYQTDAQPKKRPLGLLIGLLALVVVLAVGVGILVVQREHTREDAQQQQTLKALDDVEGLVDGEKFAQAQDKLGGLAEGALTPEFSQRARALQQRIDDQRARALKSGDADAASTADKTTLTVDAPVKAKVYVDGTFAGYTPVTLERSVGSTMIEVRAKGHKVWTKSVALIAGQPLILDADLSKAHHSTSHAGASTAKRPAKKPVAVPTSVIASKPVVPKRVVPSKVVPSKVVSKPPQDDGLLFKPGRKSKASSDLLSVD